MAKLSISWLLISFLCFILISKVQNSENNGVGYESGREDALSGPAEDNEGFGGQNGREWEEGGKHGNGRQSRVDYDDRHYNREMGGRPMGEKHGGRSMGERHGRGGRRGRPYGESGEMDEGPRSMSK